MTRFFAKHPLGASALLMLAHPAVFLAAVYASHLWASDPLDVVFLWLPLMFWVTAFLWSFVSAFPAALLRRRSGASTAPLLLLGACLPAQTWAQSMALLAAHNLQSGAGPATVLSNLVDASVEVLGWGMLLSAAGALAGAMAGILLARYFIRAGRWEHIVPIGGTEGLAVRKSLAQHPLVAAPLLYLPGFFVLVAFGLAARAAHWEIPWVMAGLWGGLCLMGPLTISLTLTLLRRRSGLGTRALFLLMLMLPAQTLLLHWPVALALADPPGDWAAYWQYLIETFGTNGLHGPPYLWLALFHLPILTGGILAALGILLGLAIARWKLRTGRWEHVVPVDRPQGGA